MGTSQLEVDYASVDGDTKPGVAGFLKMKASNVKLVTPRGIYGRPAGGQSPVFKDPVWLRDKDDIVAAGLNRSSYILLCVPRSGMYTPEPEIQIDAFADYVQVDRPVLGKKPHDLVPCIDVEEASDILSPSAYYDWVLRAAKRFRARYGVWPAIYTSARVWHEYLGDHLAGQLAACPLWIAKPWPVPPNAPAIMDGAPTYQPTLIPQFGNAWASYQYQGDAIGVPAISHTADLSRARIVGPGASGQWVMWIQARCGGLAIDGGYGTKTTARVKQLQGLYALDADGLVGIDTTTLFSWLNPAPL